MDRDLRLSANKAIAASKVYDDEAVVINTVTGRYYDLEGAGADVWALLDNGTSVSQAAAELTRRYDVDAQTAGRDVERFVAVLVEADLVVATESGDEPAPAETTPASEGRRAYIPPTVTTFTDMEDLLAADPPMPASYTPVWKPPAAQTEGTA